MSTIPLNLDTDTVVLPAPTWAEQPSLHRALERRRSTRAFLPEPLPLPAVSTLLWAAFGVNRRQESRRTAPSAHNWQEIDLYVVLSEGTWRYDPSGHQLLLVTAEDVRRHSGTQDFVAEAPLNLVYVADFARMVPHEDERAFLAGADAGGIAQNVYLYCAIAGLGTVVRGLIDRRELARALSLKTTQRILLAQTVGYPAVANEAGA